MLGSRRYKMSDGTIVETGNASKSWEEATYHDGSNFISCATGTQWNHESLHRSRKGRYYIERTSQWQGTHDSAEWVSNEDAVRWLLLNEQKIPDELAELVDGVTE